MSSARENPHNGGKSLNYGDTAGESFAHSSRRQEAFTKDTETELPVNINTDADGWRTKKDDPSKLPAQSMTGESGSPIRAEGAAPPVSSSLAEEGAGVNLHAGARQRGQLFPAKKPRIASFVSGVFQNEDTGPGISISHRTGDIRGQS